LTRRISLPFLSRNEDQRPAHLVVEEVRTAPFLVSISVQGTLDSQKNGTVTNQVEGTTTIISIVPEGTKVKKGDIVCELDASAIDDKLRQQSITLTTAESALTTAEENLRIQENQNASDIAAAELAYKLAELDLDKYLKGEYVQLEKASAGKVEIAREAEVQAQEAYTYARRQVAKGTQQQNIAEAARIKHDQATFDLESAKMELKVLVDFTKIRTEAELNAKALESERNLKRVQISADAKKAQYEKELTAKKLSLDVEREKYERYSRQKEACTLKAPQDGEVVYANLSSERSSRSSSQGPPVEVGATVYERQAIINLPDVTLMKVSCRVHESQIGRIRKGLPARIRVDAYSQEPFSGHVAVVSSVPMSGRFPNYDLREYDTQIYLTDDVDRIRKLRPGLTAAVEILVDNRDAVRQVPMQSVVAVSDKHTAFVMSKNGKVESRMIEIGQTNQSHVEILKGLEDGEQVVLNPRSYFAAEIAALETKYEAEKPKAVLVAIDDPAAPIAAPPGVPAVGGPAAPGPLGAPGSGAPASGGAGGGRGQRDPKEAFTSMDADASNSLTVEELPTPMQPNFEAMDGDKDGKLTLEEYTAGRAKFRTRGPGGGQGGPGGGRVPDSERPAGGPVGNIPRGPAPSVP
jgi:HlyD family secretion protein